MKLNAFEKVLAVLIALLLVITLFFGIVRNTTALDAIDMDVYSFANILKYALVEKPAKAFFSWVDDIANFYRLRDENDLLRKEIEELNSYKAALMEANRQNKYLGDLLDLSRLMSDYNLINATVIGRDLSTWSNTIEIDVGTEDGIDENYAVITPSGLIGRIYNAYDHYSIVKLLTSEDGLNKVSVLIQLNANEVASGYLETYDVEKKAFVIKLLSTNHTITPGMAVMSSGLGGVFPSGLFVGTVVEVSELVNAVGMNVYVTPAANFANIDYVSVVKMIEADK